MNKLTRAGFNKRITLIKSDIFRDFTGSDDYEKVSFYQVLNRIVILVQYSVCFVLYKKNNGVYDVHHEFLQDKLHTSSLKKALSSIDGNLPSYLFNIYGSEYSLLVFTINKCGGEYVNSEELKLEFIVNNNDEKIDTIENYISSCCCSILGSEKKFSKKSRYKNLILNSITNIEEYKDHTCPIDKDVNSNDLENLCVNLYSEFNEVYNKDYKYRYDYIRLIKKGCFNRIYRGVGKSLLFIDKNNENEGGCYPPNIFFNIRNYFRDNNRLNSKFFEGYKYNINYIFPDDIDCGITSFLKKLKGIDSIYSYSDYVNRHDKDYDKESTITLEQANTIDSNFWSILKSDNGVEKIKEIARLPFGDNARSFCDRVYSDGLLYFYAPFEIGGFRRIKNATENDKIRVVLLYYYASLYFNYQESTKQKISLIIAPIIISSTVWGTMSHFILIDDINEEFKSKDAWLRNYQYYNSVVTRSEKLISIEIRKAYLTFISAIYLIQFRKFISNIQAANKKLDSIKLSREKFQTSVNDRLNDLTYFFPFSLIQIKVKIRGIDTFTEEIIEDRINFLSKSGVILFEKRRNIFYPSIENPIYDISIKDDIVPKIGITQKSIDEEPLKKKKRKKEKKSKK